MRGYPSFPCKDLLFPHGPALAQNSLILEGTVLSLAPEIGRPR